MSQKIRIKLKSYDHNFIYAFLHINKIKVI